MKIIDLSQMLYDHMPVYPGGPDVIIKKKEDIVSRYGIIFSDNNIDQEMAEIIVKRKPKFIGLSADFEFNEEIEKYLLENNIISYERLINTEKLPKKFMFYGVPLKIKEGDGSPVRAFAVIK